MQVDELTGTTIGRYRVGGRMQVLPYAAIHRANVMVDGRPVLLWSFREPYSQALGFVEALQSMAGDRRAASLPGVAQVLEIGAHDQPSPLIYLVSEDAGRGFLVGLLQTGRAPGVIATATALAQAIDGLHNRGLVHGDIQPATVAVDSGGRPLLVGHAIRTVVTRVNPRASWIDMTRGFRPPEAQHPLQPSRGGDLYGLAALTYYLLVGRPPNPDGPLAAPSQLRPQLSPAIDVALRRALSPDPKLRFATATEFAAALRPNAAAPVAAQAHRPATNRPPAGTPTVGRTRMAPEPPSTATAVPRERVAPTPVPVVAAKPQREPTAALSEGDSWVTSGTQELSRPTSNLISLVPLEPYEIEPEIRRRSGIVLLVALVVLALVLLILAAIGRLNL